MPTAAQLLVDSLVAHGIDRVFCVPGESYLGLLDALHGRADIDTVTCRHEGGAGFMAVADARLTGRPGVVCVSRGPGACHAAIALHAAEQDGVPLLLLVGQVARADLRRGAFQEIDYAGMFGGIAKWVAEVGDPDRLPGVMLRALRVATSGLPGPVVLALPEDMLTATTGRAAPPMQPPAVLAPEAAGIARLADWLATARQPLVIAGSGLDRPGGREALLTFAERFQVPVAVAFRRQDLFPNDHPLYAGDLGLANPADQMAAFHDADLVVAPGTRLGDITTQGYSFPRAGTRLVHIHDDPAVIGTQIPADLALACPPAAALAALQAGPRRDRTEWVARLAAIRTRIAAPRLRDASDGVAFEQVVAAIAPHLPADAIVTVDAGTFGAPLYRVVPYRPPQRLLAPISGAMGFGVPAAVAAGLREPGRPVICFVGDGGFLMTGSELAVARERDLPLKIVLSDNAAYGSIRIHQERDYPGRISGTRLVNPHFPLMGEAYGFAVTHVRHAGEIPLVTAALAAPGPQFIVVDTSLQAVLPQQVTP